MKNVMKSMSIYLPAYVVPHGAWEFTAKAEIRINETGCRIRACPGPEPGSGMTAYILSYRK